MRANRPLDHTVFENIKVQAFSHPLLDCRGGPVLTDESSANFRHQRNDRPVDTFAEDAPFTRYLSGEWIYIGPKYHHFGHIMAEMVHRIIPSKIIFPDQQNYLLVTTGDDDVSGGFESLDRTYREVLEFCEIDSSQITILNENTVVERLSICEPGSNFGGQPSSWYLDALTDFSSRRLDELHGSSPSPGKVYVSKSKIAHGGTILGESYIEELLRDEGFLIYHPEESTLSSQMDVYRKASDLVFCEGSACHGTELLGRGMLGRTFLLSRRIETREGLVSILEPRAKQVEVFQDTLMLGTVIVHRETRRPHTEFGVSLVDIDRLVDFFREYDLAQFNEIDPQRYFDAAEQDLRAYLNYHMHADLGDVDPWRVGEVRLQFEKMRSRFLAGHRSAPLELQQESAPMRSAETVEMEAWAAHKAKRWLDAADRWLEYRERFPYSAEGFTLGSIALIELGRFYEADALLTVAIENFPEFSEAFSNYALVAHHRRDWREAADRWEAFRIRFPLSIMGYSLGATALCELLRYAEADALIQVGLELDPEHEELLEKSAWVAQLSEDTTEARRRWEKLETQYPSNQAALNHLNEVQGELAKD
jgi:tetratricopeptide (TPR) repeat protein